jgi:hypothetical protein
LETRHSMKRVKVMYFLANFNSNLETGLKGELYAANFVNTYVRTYGCRYVRVKEHTNFPFLHREILLIVQRRNQRPNT